MRARASRSQSGMTLIEVMVAFAIVATAVVALIGLQIDALRTLDRLTSRINSNLLAEDAYARYVLNQMGYSVEEFHPRLRELYPDWNVDIQTETFDIEELPFVPVLPVGWLLDWVNVKIQNSDGADLAQIRPLWVRSENADFSSDPPGADLVSNSATAPTAGGRISGAQRPPGGND